LGEGGEAKNVKKRQKEMGVSFFNSKERGGARRREREESKQREGESASNQKN